MAMLRGRARRGQRCRAVVPHRHWKTTTFTSALRLGGMTAPMVLDGLMNRAASQAYIKQVLVPTLRRGDTVITNNLPAHKDSDVRRAIEGAGACLCYLPPYSPDFKPIENAFSKLKAILRRPPRVLSTISGTSSLTHCRWSPQKSAQTISPPPDMSRIDRILL